MSNTDWQLLTIDPAGLDCDLLLSDWEWLLPADLRPFSLTIFGDWFFEDRRGFVLFLDIVRGQLTEIAATRADFLAAREAPAYLEAWYVASLAAECRSRGLHAGPGQCLSFKLPPVVGGEVDADNIEVCDLHVHESITPQIHRQSRDLEPGTPILRFVSHD